MKNKIKGIRTSGIWLCDILPTARYYNVNDKDKLYAFSIDVIEAKYGSRARNYIETPFYEYGEIIVTRIKKW